MAALLAGRIDRQRHRQAKTILAFAQRAQIGRQMLRQHRHDAIREIDRIAAFARAGVQRRARSDIGRHISDRHPDDPAARVARIVVRQCADRIVMIARIVRIDGDQRQMPQIGPIAQHRRARLRRLGDLLIRKPDRNVMRGDGEDRGGARMVGPTDHFDDLGLARPRSMPARQGFGHDEIAIRRAARMLAFDEIIFALFAAGRLDAPAFAERMKHPKSAGPRRVKILDNARFIAIRGLFDPRQRPPADGQSRLAFARLDDQLWPIGIAIADRFGDQIAGPIEPQRLDHPGMGRRLRQRERPPPRRVQGPVFDHRRQ